LVSNEINLLSVLKHQLTIKAIPPIKTDAIDQVVKSTPGGEYLKKRQNFLKNKKYLVVEGDVWGLVSSNFQGFTAGDKVKWTKLFKDYTGTIVNLKDDKTCTIKRDSDQSTVDVDYKDLTKIGSK